ncbi:hypothetical protein Fcan01_04053 [Folsomia candida]|uniref:Ig-like domain-containing protein n=2 Tax=Folsomia candida TaxID=158441 RepID=A0A226EV13_FOLCA|nr:hypothetical protein Fcan01_04053 [Folsomia candida]
MGELSSSENKEKQTEKDASLEEESSGQKKNKNKRRPGGGSGGGGGGAAGAILSPNFLPQTMNIMNSMGCVIKKVMLGPEASCNGTFLEAAAAANAALSRHPVRPGQMSLLGGEPEEQETILEVILLPRPADKFYPPESSTLYTRVPFFVKWQTRSTDYSNWAEVNHTLAPGTWKLHKAGHFDDYGIHSFEVFNLREGESGQISVPYVASDNKILVHTWKFVVINDTAFAEKGLSQREEGSKKIFSCKSATGTTKPKLTLTKLTDDGCPVDEGMSEKRRKGSKRKSLVEEDCGPGCVAIRTDIESGIVSCLGDGVDETLRYPADIYCTGRPFFVERGKTKNLTLSPNKKKFNIPCIINNPNADVYLFHQNPNGTISDVTDYTNYDLKLGFSLNLDEISDPLGTYACTSSTNVEDDTDMVTYHVNPAPPHVFNPPQETVYGSPPFRFVWESVEELEVENKSAGNFYSGVFAKPEGNRAFVGTFEIAALSKGASGVVNVIRAKDKVVVHTWRYAYQGKYGLWVDRKLNIFKCVSPTSKIPPSLFAVECSNPNACRLKKRFMEDDPEMHLQKDPENQYHHHHHHKKNKKHGHHRENNNFVTVPVECGEGCTELKVWNDKRHGFVECRDKVGQEEVNNNEMDESLTYFLTRNSTILTESDDLEPLRTIEISSVVRTLNVGDTITFVCRANAYFYSHGFQWAIEMKNGSKRFLDSSVSQETTTGADQRQLKAEVHLTVGGKDWKAVWCYAPSLTSNLWGNASQLVYIH